jgi:hypothetical protein
MGISHEGGKVVILTEAEHGAFAKRGQMEA